MRGSTAARLIRVSARPGRRPAQAARTRRPAKARNPPAHNTDDAAIARNSAMSSTRVATGSRPDRRIAAGRLLRRTLAAAFRGRLTGRRQDASMSSSSATRHSDAVEAAGRSEGGPARRHRGQPQDFEELFAEVGSVSRKGQTCYSVARRFQRPHPSGESGRSRRGSGDAERTRNGPRGIAALARARMRPTMTSRSPRRRLTTWVRSCASRSLTWTQ